MRKFWEYQLCDARITRVFKDGRRVRLVLDGVGTDSGKVREGESVPAKLVSLDVCFEGVPEEAAALLCRQEDTGIRDFSCPDAGNGENTVRLNGISFPYSQMEWVERELPEDFFELERNPLAEFQWIFDRETGESWMIFPREIELYQAAKSAVNPRKLTDYAEAGGVGAAILTADGNLYTGVCIDTACSMGFCAEHAAAAAMITAGESWIISVVAVGTNGQIVPPCGRCREFLTSLHPDNRYAEVLLPGWKNCRLGDLLPWDWKKFE